MSLHWMYSIYVRLYGKSFFSSNTFADDPQELTFWQTKAYLSASKRRSFADQKLIFCKPSDYQPFTKLCQKAPPYSFFRFSGSALHMGTFSGFRGPIFRKDNDIRQASPVCVTRCLSADYRLYGRILRLPWGRAGVS